MISVEQREAIRRAYYVDNKSIRQIARELHCSRKTVDKALASATPARYTCTVPRTAPLLGPFKARLAELLAERELQPPKQRYTSSKLYEILQHEGYQGSPSRLRGYLSECKRVQLHPPAFLPLEFDLGQDAQVDWGEAVAVVAGTRNRPALCDALVLLTTYLCDGVSFPAPRSLLRWPRCCFSLLW